MTALAEGLGFDQKRVVRRDLSDVVGTWKRDVAVESTLAAQDRADEKVFRSP